MIIYWTYKAESPYSYYRLNRGAENEAIKNRRFRNRNLGVAMNISVVNTRGVLSEKQAAYAKNRLYYSLLRFEHRINGATIQFSSAGDRQTIKCLVMISIEGTGIISLSRSNPNAEALLNHVVAAAESKVARRVDWRSWVNVDSIAPLLQSLVRPITRLVDLAYRPWFGRKKMATAPVRKHLPEPSTARPPRPHFRADTNPLETYSK